MCNVQIFSLCVLFLSLSLFQLLIGASIYSFQSLHLKPAPSRLQGCLQKPRGSVRIHFSDASCLFFILFFYIYSHLFTLSPSFCLAVLTVLRAFWVPEMSEGAIRSSRRIGFRIFRDEIGMQRWNDPRKQTNKRGEMTQRDVDLAECRSTPSSGASVARRFFLPDLKNLH